MKNGEPVWFGCEVSKRFAAKQGIQDLNVHDFKSLFGTDIQTTLSKGERMIYRESAMTHAMTFTAVSCDVSVDILIKIHKIIFFKNLIREEFLFSSHRMMENQPNTAWRIVGVRTGEYMKGSLRIFKD